MACLQLVGAEGTDYECEPIAIATCNLPEQWDDFCHDVGVYNIANPDRCLSREGVKGPLPLTFIKDYSENKGMLDALLEHDIVIGFTEDGEETKDKDNMLWYHNGFIQAPIVAVCNPTLIEEYRASSTEQVMTAFKIFTYLLEKIYGNDNWRIHLYCWIHGRCSHVWLRSF